VAEELRRGNLPIGTGQEIIALIKELGVEILSPMNIKDKTVGIIALSVKESGDMYNDEDYSLLRTAGAQTAIALENALLYQEVSDFNIRLKDDIDAATKDLLDANEKLTKLDQAKSDFISIASHQLRTPLTVVKGYISMMLEGDFGKINKEELSALEKVYESNERLIQLVENLLNISRIESGRLQFKFETMQFEKLSDSVVDELSGNAAKKGLKLNYSKPKKALPPVVIDQEKIRQVLINMVDNSIKYTKQGTVSVKVDLVDFIPPVLESSELSKRADDSTQKMLRSFELSQSASNKAIRFTVADTGMGISPNDLPHLFNKFTRGTGTVLVHTEGTGLGMYVARMMVEAHQGKIWAESEGEGRGAKFIMEIPIKKT
jgi:signal transduction histidine kinase